MWLLRQPDYFVGSLRRHPGGAQGSARLGSEHYAAENLAEFHLGSPTTLEADLLALKEGEPESEKKFDFSSYGNDGLDNEWHESWKRGGTGWVKITEEFTGCGCADWKWKIHEEVVNRKADR